MIKKNKAAHKPCSVREKISLIIICLVFGLLQSSSGFKGSADTSNAFLPCIRPGFSQPVFFNTAGEALNSPLHHRSCLIKAVSSIFSVPLSASLRCPEFLRRSVLGCTDFPHPEGRDYPAALFFFIIT